MKEPDKKKKKMSLFELVKASMTKTGGCCGPGESCCTSPADEKAPPSRPGGDGAPEERDA